MYGPFLRQLRTSRGMTQRQLAEISGISQPNISAYERGHRQPTIDVLNRIMVSCGYLLTADGGGHSITAPLPKVGWFPLEDLPPRLPDDPPDEPSTMPWGASIDERVAAIHSLQDAVASLR